MTMENTKVDAQILTSSSSNSATSASTTDDFETSVINSDVNGSHDPMGVEDETDISSQGSKISGCSNSQDGNTYDTPNDSTNEKQDQELSDKQNQDANEKEIEDTSEKRDQSEKAVDDEIINLADDDDDEVSSNTCEVYERQDRGYFNNCMNPDCTSGIDLAPPAMFVLTYFGMKKCRDQFICAECFNKVVRHQEKLAGLLENNQSLIESDFPVNNAIILLDSDEEDVPDEGGDLSEEVMSVIQKHLQNAVNKSVNHYDIDFQIQSSVEYLNNKLACIEDSSKELSETFDRLQDELDSMRKQVYDMYRHPIRELEELHISQCEIPSLSSSQREIRDVTQPDSNRVDFSHAASSDFIGQDVVAGDLTKIKPPSDLPPVGPIVQKKLNVDDLVYAVKVSFYSAWVLARITEVIPSKTKTDMGQDVVALDQERARPPANLPPIGPILRPQLKVDDLVFVMRVSFYSTWVMARIIDIIPNKSKHDINNLKPFEMYRVRVESQQHRKTILVKNVVGRYLALPDPSPVRLPVGTRIIAAFKDEGRPFAKDDFYSGVIAEPPKTTNKFRYLIFFDDGYAQYVSHENVRLVCESSKNVWEDIHPESREFIRSYMQAYPERPMVKLQEGQMVKTEWMGHWWTTRVLEVDGSLVKVHFDADSRTEWIYRGSTRLLPLFNEFAAAKGRQQSGTLTRGRGFGGASMKQYNAPYVEYTRPDPEDKRPGEDTGDEVFEVVPTRSVARKSTAKKTASETASAPVVVNANIPKPLKEPSEGKIEEKKLVNPMKPLKFKPHRCNKSCVAWTKYTFEKAKGISLLAVPLNFGFQRVLCRYKGKRAVMYVTPCGMRIRQLDEMLDYLRTTNSLLTIDMFDFDMWVNCTAEFQLEKTFLHIEDLSYGKERVPISCVNDLDHHNPTYVEYMTERQPAEGVHLNLDKNFLSGCDCEDDCADRSKCACWRLTMEGAVFAGVESDIVYGYQYRRLPERVTTGIYECNSQCKCKSTCLNRVVQQPLAQKLQLFKTALKGWGIRCLNDIPRGTFLCIYAGFLLTEQEANEGGKNYGDEYLAELDYIEVVERVKEDYEENAAREAEDEQTREKKKNEDINKEKSTDEEQSGENSSNSSRRGDADEDIDMNWQSMENGSQDDNSMRSRLRKRRANALRESYDEEYDSEEVDDPDSEEEEEEMDIDEEDNRGGECGVCYQPLNDPRDRIKCTGMCGKSFHSRCTPIRNPVRLSKLGRQRLAWVCMDCKTEGGSSVRKPSRFTPAAAVATEEEDYVPKNPSVRDLFGPDESVYIMDAKTNGNIGRYLNHSCSPNVFVQNVFVDTHDLRFPWVAFFAASYIRAGTELTWDYNYDVGSVPGKVLHCYCGSHNCRGRLL